MSSRSSLPRRRRSSISSNTSSSTLALRPAKAFDAPKGSGGSTDAGLVPNSRISVRPSRSASRRGPGSSPNTARRMISSVSPWRRGCSAMGSPVGQRPTSRSVTSATNASRRSTASPWKAGSMSLRCSRCDPSSSRITEWRPTIGSRIFAPSPGCSTSGAAVKTSWISSGSEIITNGGAAGRKIVKRRP